MLWVLIGFYEDLTKIIFQLLSNTHLVSSSDMYKFFIQEEENKEASQTAPGLQINHVKNG